jgi:hypothetical protein
MGSVESYRNFNTNKWWNKKRTVKIKRELVKIGEQLSVKDGRERSIEDVVKYLIDTHKKIRNNSFSNQIKYIVKRSWKNKNESE